MHKVVNWLDTLGFMECVPGDVGPHVLRMTLINASNIKHQSSFYFEAWSEPSDGYPKNSRVHRPARGTLNLGCEQLEIDWYGDEQELVLHAVQYTGPMQSKDMPIAEVRIPRAAIERYAREARLHEADMQQGTRTFELTALQRHHAIKRKLRFQDMLLPKEMFAGLLAKVGAENGLHVPSPSEVEQLREENKKIRSENHKLKLFSSGASCSDAGCGGCAPGLRDRRMSVAVRFELVPRRSSDMAVARTVRQASFQEK